MRLLLLLMALGPLFAAGATEFMIDTLGRHTQWSPAVAFDGTNFFVVWDDRRPSGRGTYGSRVSPTAGVLDPVGIPVSVDGALHLYPAVAFDGVNYLVVWEIDNGTWNNDIHGARVTPAGVVLDTAPIIISDALRRQLHPALAFDGINYLVVWADLRNGEYDVYGSRVTTSGIVLDPAGIVISTAPDLQTLPKVVFDGTSFFVVWDDYRSGDCDIYGCRVTPGGTVLDSAGLVISDAPGKQIVVKLAFDGANYLAVWADERNLPRGIYGARVRPSGTVLDTAGIPVATESLIRYWPAVTFDGTDYVAVWQARSTGSSDLHGGKISPDGTVGEELPVVVANYSQQHPAVAYGSGEVFLVYTGFVYIIGGKYYNSDRTWGKFGPFVGVKEAREPLGNRQEPMATIVRGVLVWQAIANSQSPMADGSRQELLDAAGRKVMELQAGPNDVRHLAPGVYFVRRDGGRTTKVAIGR